MKRAAGSLRIASMVGKVTVLVVPSACRSVTTSMSFCWGKGDLFVERIGEHVLGDLIPLRRMLDAGLIVGCGTDWGPKNVFEHVALAETHEFAGSGRRNDGPAQRVEAVLRYLFPVRE